MVNRDLLNKIGIKINSQYETQADSMSNHEVIKDAISSTKRGQIRDWFLLGLGLSLTSIGSMDISSNILEKYITNTTKDFNEFSLLEIGVGLFSTYISCKSIEKRQNNLKYLTNSLNNHYVKD